MVRILIVDDEVSILDGLRRNLRSFEKAWQISFVDTSSVALEILKQEKVDVFVFDMDVPKPDGAELSSITADLYPNMARIAMSGKFDVLTTYSMTTGPHRFLEKPFNPLQLIRMINDGCEEGQIKISPHDPYSKAELTPALSREQRKELNRERLRRLNITF